MNINIVITNEFGEFCGKRVDVGEEQYKTILDMSKGFYNNGGFELTLECGSVVIFPPEIVKKSFLTIKRNG